MALEVEAKDEAIKTIHVHETFHLTRTGMICDQTWALRHQQVPELVYRKKCVEITMVSNIYTLKLNSPEHFLQLQSMAFVTVGRRAPTLMEKMR